MKNPKRKKPEPKFKAGEVVFHVAHREFYKIRRVYVYQRLYANYTFVDRSFGSLESELRPLTAKEIGPRRKRG
ncbi:hypothetical protein LCGC14_2725510 [marine sediment metagenome]|uniref:Uncharacterized protein n=1 Tax=marine sediment metagenome TaxID=412755 RepID=A0A0F9C0I5_9ZZZZ